MTCRIGLSIFSMNSPTNITEKAMFKYFIFDLDGTIAYTLEDLRTAMNLMLDKFSFKKMTVSDILNSINHGTREFVRGCLPLEHQRNEELLDKAIEIYFKHYNKVLLDTTKPYPSVIEALDYYKAHGAKMAVFSNKHDANTKVICNALFPNYFDFAIGGNNGRFEHKPSPQGALYIAEQFGAKPEEVAFVGDSDVDMNTAKNAGMYAVGVNWGYRPAELLRELGAKKIICGYEDFVSLMDD